VSRSGVIVGIDPGLCRSGLGVVEFSAGDVVRCIECGVIETDSGDRMENRLSTIFDGICRVVDLFKPTDIAMESVFVNMNPHTSEKLIMARTAAFIAASKSGLIVNEYPPNVIKKSITGSGHASKSRIHTMVQMILNLKQEKALSPDSADALAVAVCHCFASRFNRIANLPG
jgi:crossover junction endodeoxyribonuclease RuvC